jgi:tetratricopeptide (TPR) repeat protein
MVSVICVAMLSYLLQESPRTEKHIVASFTEPARAEYQRGHFAEAEALLIEALRNIPRLDETDRARVLSDLGDVFVNEDQLPKAEQVYAQALAIHKRLRDDTGVAMMLRNFGALYSLQRRDGEAVRALKESLRIARTAHLNSTFIGRILNNFGVVYHRQGNIGKAERFITEALQTSSSADPLQYRADLLNNLGVVYHANREYAKGEDHLKQALNIMESVVGPEHPDLTFSLSSLGVLFTDAGKYTEAEEQYLRALRLLQSGNPVFDTRIARLLHSLSNNYSRAARHVEAEETLSRAATIARRNISEHPDMAQILDAYARTLRKRGKTKEAEELRVEVRRARVAAGLVINALNPF